MHSCVLWALGLQENIFESFFVLQEFEVSSLLTKITLGKFCSCWIVCKFYLWLNEKDNIVIFWKSQVCNFNFLSTEIFVYFLKKQTN